MKRILCTLVLSFSACAQPRASAPVLPQEPITGIIRLFDEHSIVMLGEIHGSIQFDELLKEIIRTPTFAERVNDIVIEFGNALHQDILDRYVDGGDVPLEKLGAVWQDVVGAPGGIALSPYHDLIGVVRQVNRGLPRGRKLRVLAGDPPIDWRRVESREDIAPFLPFRDEHYASVVRYEVLARRRKALLVMGAGHFVRRDGRPGLIEQQMLSAFVKPYVIIAGCDVVHRYDDIDPRFTATGAPQPPWIIELKGSWVGALTRWSDTPLIGFPATRGNSGSTVGAWEQAADAFLFLGPRDKMTGGGETFDLEGTPYGAELRRRWKIMLPYPPGRLPKSDGSILPAIPRQ